jgi:uncharacterized membrane protein YfcA
VPSAKRSFLVLTGIGLASGFLSALFGVGGGLLVVPMLVLLMGLTARAATATSLAAIGITAVAGVTSFAVLESVDWGAAVLVGFPALFGSLAGIQLQHRVSSRMLTRLFAAFVAVVGVLLFFE